MTGASKITGEWRRSQDMSPAEVKAAMGAAGVVWVSSEGEVEVRASGDSPILVWRFHHAPPEYQALSTNAGRKAMTDHPQSPDLDALEALARAATPGPWETAYTQAHCVKQLSDDGPFSGKTVVMADCWKCSEDIDNADLECIARHDEDAKYIAAVNPQAVLALIALVRRLQRALQVGEAESITRYYKNSACSITAAVCSECEVEHNYRYTPLYKWPLPHPFPHADTCVYHGLHDAKEATNG